MNGRGHEALAPPKKGFIERKEKKSEFYSLNKFV